jgi:single-strand DNA-binding protein
MNYNRATIAGRVTKDPEIKTTKNGTNVARFSLAVNNYYTSADGAKHEDVQFLNIVVFGRTVTSVIEPYVVKGQVLLVSGRIVTNSWEGKDGEKKYRTEIVADTIQLGQRPNGSEDNAPRSEKKPARSTDEQWDSLDYPSEEISPDDIPF